MKKYQSGSAQRPSSETGPKTPPAVLNLPGGRVVRGYDFRITNVDAEGRPTAFERAERNTDSDCVLWALESFVGEPLPAELHRRMVSRQSGEVIDEVAYTTNKLVLPPSTPHESDDLAFEKAVGDPKLRALVMERVRELSTLKADSRDGLCIDCETTLVACTCHAGCPGAMCPKCETPHVKS